MRELISFCKVKDVQEPSRAYDHAAGLDFYVPRDFNNAQLYMLNPNESVLIPSGIKVVLPIGFCLVAMNKSGVAINKQLIKGAELIDADYRGEIHLHVINTSNKPQAINPGDMLMQFVFLSCPAFELVETGEIVEDTRRGAKGFGSSGT